jgi:hypothetical protein
MVSLLVALADLMEWKNLAGTEGGIYREIGDQARKGMTEAVDKIARKSDVFKNKGV